VCQVLLLLLQVLLVLGHICSLLYAESTAQMVLRSSAYGERHSIDIKAFPTKPCCCCCCRSCCCCSQEVSGFLNLTLGLDSLTDKGQDYKVFQVFVPLDHTTLIKMSMRSPITRAWRVQAAMDCLQAKLHISGVPMGYENPGVVSAALKHPLLSRAPVPQPVPQL
jgi:hypothetical protein